VPREIDGERAYRAICDSRVAEVASRQDGVITRAQLATAGLDKDGVRRRVDAGRLHPLFTSVFAVGHRAVTRQGWFRAALLQVGGDAALSHESANQHLGTWNGKTGTVHVMTTRKLRNQPKLRIHTTSSMPALRNVDGLRTVRADHALLQLAAHLDDPEQLRRAAREAQYRGLTTHPDLLAITETGARGAKRLRTALRGGPARTQNGGEDAALDFLRDCGLDPVSNEKLLGFRPDFWLPEHNLVIEFDGRDLHDIPIVAADDRRRQATFEAAGIRVLRIDWLEVTTRPLETRRRIAAATS
jgi:hypothetical protein